MRKTNFFIKRLLDLVGSSIGIIILILVFLIISVLIKLNSKGPIFFRQERLGRNSKIFKIVKFRTMVVNAEKMGDGLRVKTEDDKRITRIGKFLRKTSLDELPQLFNVFIGQMSLVGPRPPVTYHPYDGYKNYPDWTLERFLMRPGITGLAQVTVRNSVGWNDRIKIDIKYVKGFNI